MSRLKTPPKLSVDPIEAQYFEGLNKRTSIAATTDPTGGATVDAECRAQLIALMDAMRSAGLLNS